MKNISLLRAEIMLRFFFYANFFLMYMKLQIQMKGSEKDAFLKLNLKLLQLATHEPNFEVCKNVSRIQKQPPARSKLLFSLFVLDFFHLNSFAEIV